jgi:eukaryotic-like serine/threonine-protein kinase
MTAALRSFVATWLEQIASLRYADLAGRQEPPFASLPFGAAGIAYALLRAGRTLGDRALLLRGEDWAAAAARHARSPQGLALPGGIPVATSLAYSRDGIRFVQVLLAQALGDAARTKARVAAFVRARGRPRSPELLFGTAGHLAGTLILFEATRDPRLAALAEEHAQALLRSTAWTTSPDLSFAHGRAGIFHALLRLERITGSGLPGWVLGQLERTAGETPAWEQKRRSAPRAEVLTRSWCNGSAGMTLLWAAAFARTQDRRYQRLARAAARASLTAAARAGGDLCCGLGGRAYALLAADGAVPGAGFRQNALSLAVAATRQLRGPWPNGLLKGYPGIVCLALDLAHERQPRGFPLVEA